MRPVRKLGWIGGASALLLLSSVSTAIAGGGHGDHDHDGHSSAKVLQSDLSSPKGLAVNADRNLVIGQGAFGPPGPVLEFFLRGPNRGTSTPVTDPFNIVDVAISPKDGTGWAISPVPVVDPTTGEPVLDPETGEPITEGHLFHQLADGTIVDVLNIPGYQAGDPDPVDRDVPPNAIESNPYGLTVMRNGDALVADAAGNDIIRVTPDGAATTVARFDIEAVATDHLPPDFPGGPLPETMETEAVPTTVTIGPDGAIYVGELKGFPFRPGTSNIWRIKPNADGALCSVNTKDPTRKCSLYSGGYTGIQDIAFDKNNGRLYVYEFAEEGVLAFEAGFETGEFPPAVLLEVKRGWHGDKRTELATGELSQPGGIVVTNGKIYVTDGMFTGGRLLRISRNGW